MCCNHEENERNSCCLADILKVILRLQRKEECGKDLEGCDKPFLGPTPTLNNFNTRPITLYNCCTNALWTIDFELNGTTGTSSVFRVENVDDCCLTCRVLAPNPDTAATDTPFVATNSFFTINLNCVGAIKCLADIFVPCI